MNASSNELMTTKEVAGWLKVAPKTVENWRYRGQIPYVKINGVVRYRRMDIESWLEKSIA